MIKLMQSEVEKLEYIRTRIASAYNEPQTSTELGDLALEIMILRNDLESGSPDTNAAKMLSEIKELEKSVISLYMLQRMNRGSKNMFSNIRDYSIFAR